MERLLSSEIVGFRDCEWHAALRKERVLCQTLPLFGVVGNLARILC